MSKVITVSPFSSVFAYVPQIEEVEYIDAYENEYSWYVCDITIPPSLLARRRAEFELFEKNILNILDYLNGHISLFVLLCRLFPNERVAYNYHALSGRVVDAIAAYEHELK